MPRRRRRKYTTSSKRRTSSRRKSSSWNEIELSLSPDTMAEITAILLVLMGTLFLLSLLGLFGSLGNYIGDILRQVFGWISYVFSTSLIILGGALFYPAKYKVISATYIGFFLFNLALPSLVHLFISSERSFEVATSGNGGGFVGYFIADNLEALISFSGALIVLLALLLISILLLFNTSFKKISERLEGEPYEINIHANKKLGKIKINLPRQSFKDKITSKIKRQEEEIDEAKFKEEEGGRKKKEPSLIEASEGKDNIEQVSFDWEYPALELLEDSRYQVDSGNITANAEIIAKTLSQFGIQVTMQDINVGPTFTQYTLRPHEGTKLSKITALQDDLALALATHPIRIEAPIPGKSLLGVEVPNKKVAKVRLKEILESGEYHALAERGHLVVALGKDVSGAPIVADISRMPHLLIAGATGSGKSVCVNGVLMSLLYRYSPKYLKLILVDPKRVELSGYNGIAHLLTPVVTEPDKTVNAFRWAVLEMENRYKLLSENSARDIAAYNKKANEEERIPYIMIIVDELADVMIQAAAEVENLVVRIAQMARAVGIHLVVATQRPSVNVVTGLIKANIPTRIAFRVASQIDSRTILDTAGADRLIGRGDMLFMGGDGQKPRRIQGVFVSDREIKNVIDHIKEQSEPEYNEEVVKSHKLPFKFSGRSDFAQAIDDDMYQEAYDVVVQSGKASASLLQRRLRVGYARAARLLDLLEEQGIIGPADGAKPREILVSGAGKGDEGIYDNEWEEEGHA